MPLTIQREIPLAPLTSIRLGGNAKEYAVCERDEDILAALSYANENQLRVHVLGGGSNSIFADAGFDGLVIHIQTKGITIKELGSLVTVTAKAGEDWESVVEFAIAHGLSGIECLSGIPGSCGGTPLQNVGAYGQEVAQTISVVDAIDRTTLQYVSFTNTECAFGYRTSRFKEEDSGRYIITAVSFELNPSAIPVIRYGELHDALGDDLAPGTEGLRQIRQAVRALRKKKSMLIDPSDPNSISCGSFFTNPIIPATVLHTMQSAMTEQIPYYDAGSDNAGNPLVKLSAAWLVEHAGFQKGTTRKNVGISQNHSLALINIGGTTNELISFAEEIRAAVQQQYGISLAFEPLVMPTS